MAIAAVLLAAGVLLGSVRGTEGFVFTLDRTECFTHHLDQDNEWVFSSFVVSHFDDYWGREEPNLLSLKVKDPHDTVVHHTERQSSDDFYFFAHEKGDYTFCYENHGPTHASVSVDIRQSHEEPHKDIAKAEHVDHIAVELERLQTEVQHAHHDVWYCFYMANLHSEVDKKVARRVLWRSLFQAVLLVACSAAQVYLLRRLFEKRLRTSRV